MPTMDEREDLRLDLNDRRSLIESLSLDLITDSVNKQIEYTLGSTTDFLTTAFDKFRMILDMEDIDEEDRQDLKYQMIDFCEDLIRSIGNKFDLFVDHTSMDYESIMQLLYSMYNFFVLNRANNVEKFLINYIHQNKLAIIDSLGLSYDAIKDITGYSNKKKNINKDDIVVLSSLTSIIDFVTKNNIIDPMEFLETIDDGEIYVSNIINYFNSAVISGNFVNILFNDILNDDYDSNELSKIRNDLRISFYNN